MPGFEFSPSIAHDIRGRIEAKLTEIEAHRDVRLLFAIESGSRAWGFPSPDSDYDVRFVYVHRADWYLSLTPGRDVIELPIEDDLDIGGWELREALNLLLKPNPVILEWMSSPVRYRWDDEACAALASLAGRLAHQTACRHHYLSLGRGQWAKHVGDVDEVSLKKYFYILRPALALRWIRLNPEERPPMNLQDLIGGVGLDETTLGTIGHLLELKARAKEIGTGLRLPEIDRLILSEFERAEAAPNDPRGEDLRGDAGELFQSLVKGQL